MGFEPTTSSLARRHSSQLNYRRKIFKSEIRNPKQITNFNISNLFRISLFEFRISIKEWAEEDLNLHPLRDMLLRHARLPIPPSALARQNLMLVTHPRLERGTTTLKG